MKDDMKEQNEAYVMKKISDDSSMKDMEKESMAKTVRLQRQNDQSPKSKVPKRIFYAAGCVVVLLLVILMLERSGVSEEERIVQEKLSGKLKYMELIRRDPTLYNAVKHDLFQNLDMTDTDGDYSLTLDGLIADEHRAIILYTFIAPNQPSRRNVSMHTELRNGNNEHFSHWIRSSSLTAFDKESLEKTLTDSGYIEIESEQDVVIPDRLNFNVEIDDKTFKFIIPNDQNRYAGMKRTYQPEQSFSIGDQKLTVHEVNITPLAAYARITADSHNTQNINSMISMSILNEQGKRYTERGGSGTISLPDGYTAQFHSNYFDDSEALYLAAEGAYISDRDKILVINTDTKETLLAPSDHITLSEVTVEEDKIKIGIFVDEIEFPLPDHQRFFTLLDSDAGFTDAEGNRYKVDGNVMMTGDSRSDDNKGEQMSYYTLPKENYAQPLTFAVYEYPGFIKEKVNIRLDSNEQ